MTSNAIAYQNALANQIRAKSEAELNAERAQTERTERGSKWLDAVGKSIKGISSVASLFV